MCLDKLTKFKVEPARADGLVKGWKVFEVNGDELLGDCIEDQKTRGWNKADTSQTVGRRPKYRSGYHIWITKEGAADWCDEENDNEVVVSVYYMPEDVTAKGLQCDHKCVVVKRMWIEPHDYDAAVKK